MTMTTVDGRFVDQLLSMLAEALIAGARGYTWTRAQKQRFFDVLRGTPWEVGYPDGDQSRADTLRALSGLTPSAIAALECAVCGHLGSYHDPKPPFPCVGACDCPCETFVYSEDP